MKKSIRHKLFKLSWNFQEGVHFFTANGISFLVIFEDVSPRHLTDQVAQKRHWKKQKLKVREFTILWHQIKLKAYFLAFCFLVYPSWRTLLIIYQNKAHIQRLESIELFILTIQEGIRFSKSVLRSKILQKGNFQSFLFST